jgi:hypothetical protein
MTKNRLHLTTVTLVLALATGGEALANRVLTIKATSQYTRNVSNLLQNGHNIQALRLAKDTLRAGRFLPGGRTTLRRLTDQALVSTARQLKIAAEDTLQSFRGLRSGNKDKVIYGGHLLLRARDRAVHVPVLGQAFRTRISINEVLETKSRSARVNQQVERLHLPQYSQALRTEINAFIPSLNIPQGFSLHPDG